MGCRWEGVPMGKANIWSNVAVRTVALFVALCVIGVGTRFPALQFSGIYALHGVFAAPFFAALAMVHFDRDGGIGPLLVATLCLAALLGAMSPVMGGGFALSALALTASWFVAGRRAQGQRTFASAVVYGAFGCFGALLFGILFGSYLFDATVIVQIIACSVLAIALAVLGAVVAAR